MRVLLALAVGWLPASAAALEAVNCVGENLASIAHVMEPLEDNTRSYAQGAVRVLILSAPEPACCGAAIAVLLPDPLDGARVCRLLVTEDGLGWGSVTFGPGTASYDPVSGLSIPMTTSSWDGEDFRPQGVTVTVDQRTGRVALR